MEVAGLTPRTVGGTRSLGPIPASTRVPFPREDVLGREGDSGDSGPLPQTPRRTRLARARRSVLSSSGLQRPVPGSSPIAGSAPTLRKRRSELKPASAPPRGGLTESHPLLLRWGRRRGWGRKRWVESGKHARIRKLFLCPVVDADEENMALGGQRKGRKLGRWTRKAEWRGRRASWSRAGLGSQGQACTQKAETGRHRDRTPSSFLRFPGGEH